MSTASKILRTVVATVCLAFSTWLFYLRAQAKPLLWISSHPAQYTLAAIGAILALGILLMPLKARGGREVTGLAPGTRDIPKGNPIMPFLGLALGALVLAGSHYLSHAAIFTDERPLWLDRYAPIFSPVFLAAITAAWLYDTAYGRILTGTASGKSQTKQRALLIVKRLVVAALVAGIMLQTVVPILNIAPSSPYGDPTSRLMLSAICALAVSLVFIGRAPAFTPSSNGSVREFI